MRRAQAIVRDLAEIEDRLIALRQSNRHYTRLISRLICRKRTAVARREGCRMLGCPVATWVTVHACGPFLGRRHRLETVLRTPGLVVREVGRFAPSRRTSRRLRASVRWLGVAPRFTDLDVRGIIGLKLSSATIRSDQFSGILRPAAGMRS